MIQNNRGSTQSTTILAISVTTLLILAVVIIFFVRGQITERNAARRDSKVIAEFGMEQALKKIEQDPQWRKGFTSTQYKNGFYTVQIEALEDSIYKAVSIGHAGKLQEKIICTYRLRAFGDSVKPVRLSFE